MHKPVGLGMRMRIAALKSRTEDLGVGASDIPWRPLDLARRTGSYRSPVRRAIVAGLLLAAFVPGVTFAYTQNVYNSANNNKQAMHCWCVVGATKTWLGYVAGSTSVSQATLNTYITQHDKYNYTGQKCNDGSSGHDPRGWAWGIAHYTPQGLYYNDYWSTSQSAQDWELVYAVRASNQPAGAVVLWSQGTPHAVLVLGYQDQNDPWQPKPQSLYGFYIFDPWYGNGNSGMANWGSGFPPDSYITISSWNSTYFTADPYSNFWSGKYVTIMRSVSGNPSDHPTQSYGDYVAGHVAPGVAPVTGGDGSHQFGYDSTEPTVSAAVAEGIATNALAGPGSRIDVKGYRVGAVVHVDSLANELPSYELAELRVDGRIRAVAKVDDTPNGFVFAGLSSAREDYPFATSSLRARYESANGLRPGGKLVWAWTSDVASPYTPFIVSSDPSGRPTYLTPGGLVSEIHLSAGLTPRS